MQQGLFSEQLVIGTLIDVPSSWKQAKTPGPNDRKRRHAEYPAIPQGVLLFTPNLDEDEDGVYARATHRTMWDVSCLTEEKVREIQFAGVDKLGIIGSQPRTTFARSGPCNLLNTGPDSIRAGENMYYCTSTEFKTWAGLDKNDLSAYTDFLSQYYQRGGMIGQWDDQSGPAIVLPESLWPVDENKIKYKRFIGKALVGGRSGKYINARLRQYA